MWSLNMDSAIFSPCSIVNLCASADVKHSKKIASTVNMSLRQRDLANSSIPLFSLSRQCSTYSTTVLVQVCFVGDSPNGDGFIGNGHFIGSPTMHIVLFQLCSKNSSPTEIQNNALPQKQPGHDCRQKNRVK